MPGQPGSCSVPCEFFFRLCGPRYSPLLTVLYLAESAQILYGVSQSACEHAKMSYLPDGALLQSAPLSYAHADIVKTL